jgi:hypothetical protein
VSLLTLAELAAHLHVSTRHLERCAARGMPSIPVGARAKRYDAAACLAWLAQEGACQSSEPRKAGTKFVSRSAVDAFTDACRQVQLRAVPGNSKPS